MEAPSKFDPNFEIDKMIITNISYLPFYFKQTTFKNKTHLLPLGAKQWLAGVHCNMCSSRNFKENIFFDLASPMENYCVFFNLSGVMTLSLEKDK